MPEQVILFSPSEVGLWTIDHTFDVLAQMRDVEINQKRQLEATQLQIRKHLRLVYGQQV